MTDTKPRKIAVLKPFTTGAYKDDTTMFIEGMRKYMGWEVIEVPLFLDDTGISAYEPFDHKILKGVDMYWAPYEPLIKVAHMLQQEYPAPVVGHFEIVPPWRVNLDKVYNAYCGTNQLTEDDKKHYKDYKEYALAWYSCEERTMTDPYTLYNIEKLLGFAMDKCYHIKPYPLDNELLDSFRKEQEPKFQICTISRLVPHKRIHHVIEALSQLKKENRPHYVVVGGGPEKQRLINLANQLDVSIEFKDLSTDAEKAKVIQESMFCVQLWSWLPVGEAAYLKRCSIAYDHPDTRHRLRNMPLYSDCNDIRALSNTIEYLTDNPHIRTEYAEDAYSELIENHTDTHLLEEATKRLVTIFNEVLK